MKKFIFLTQNNVDFAARLDDIISFEGNKHEGENGCSITRQQPDGSITFDVVDQTFDEVKEKLREHYDFK